MKRSRTGYVYYLDSQKKRNALSGDFKTRKCLKKIKPDVYKRETIKTTQTDSWNKDNTPRVNACITLKITI